MVRDLDDSRPGSRVRVFNTCCAPRRACRCYTFGMLKGSREAVLRKIQPISVHGQISLDVHYIFPDDESEQIRVARVGPEAVTFGLEPGDRVVLEFLLGTVTSITRARA
jgi:hypothetical protein